MKKIIFAMKLAMISLNMLGLILNPLTYIMPNQALAQEEVPQYVPGELIVKIKEDKSLEDIQGLNAKYKIIAQERVFKGLPDHKEELKKLRKDLAQLGAEHEKWYWQTDKESREYKGYLAKIEKEKEALKKQIKTQEELLAKQEAEEGQFPEGQRPPRLDSIYLLKTEGRDIDIEIMAQKYSQNPNVEYAEPNYIAKVEAYPETLPNDFFLDPEQKGTLSHLIFGGV